MICHMSVAIVTVNLLLIVLLKKTRSLRTRAMYLVINLTIVDMFVGGFSHFSLFATLLYLCDIVQFPHLKGLCQLEIMRVEVMQITFSYQNSIVFNA